MQNLGAGLGKSLDSPSTLAIKLQRIGLPKNFLDLRIFSCNSGVIYPTTQQETSYAEQLLVEMHELGYHDISVSGYSGWVSLNKFNNITYKSSRIHYKQNKNVSRGFEVCGNPCPASSVRKTFSYAENGTIKTTVSDATTFTPPVEVYSNTYSTTSGGGCCSVS